MTPLELKILNSIATKGIDYVTKEGYLQKAWAIVKGRKRFLVIGSAGAGKSNFLESLRSPLPEAISPLDRTKILHTIDLSICGNPMRFIDTPGHDGYHGQRSKAYRNAIKKTVRCLINVVSYGYHEYGAPKEKVILNDAVRLDYLEEHRRAEIKRLKESGNLLSNEGVAGQLITLVTKADLWWDMKEQVMDYYENGMYSKELGSMQNLNPVVIPYCSVVHRFYGLSSSGTLEDKDRTVMRARALSDLIVIANNK